MSEAVNTEKKQKKSAGHIILNIVAIILCVVLIPILVMNIIMIIQDATTDRKVPSIFGYSPLIVLTDSMFPTIESGDLIFVKKADPATIKEGDVISFFDPQSTGDAVVTHRVLVKDATDEDGLPVTHNPENKEGVYTEGGVLYYRTQGDANNTPDQVPVPAENLVGIWTGTHLKGVGSAAQWLQTTPGLIVCIAVPVLLLIGYDVIRRRFYDKGKAQDNDALLKELEELRAAKAAAEKTQETVETKAVEVKTETAPETTGDQPQA